MFLPSELHPPQPPLFFIFSKKFSRTAALATERRSAPSRLFLPFRGLFIYFTEVSTLSPYLTFFSVTVGNGSNYWTNKYRELLPRHSDTAPSSPDGVEYTVIAVAPMTTAPELFAVQYHNPISYFFTARVTFPDQRNKCWFGSSLAELLVECFNSASSPEAVSAMLAKVVPVE